MQTSARVGAATDGGDVRQQWEGVAGRTWLDGGVVATLSYDRNSAITADQRDFSHCFDASAYILPSMRHLDAVVSGHQALGSRVEADLDVLYSRRTSYTAFSNSTSADFT